MKIVIDVGCARYGGDYSIERLLEEFAPDVLYGFDPNETDYTLRDEHGLEHVVIRRAAAWTRDGTVGYVHPGLGGWISEQRHHRMVPCVDLARFIRELPAEAEIVLKCDAEGAEYELLEHLIAEGVDSRLALAWVEFHPEGSRPNSLPDVRRESIEARIGCELRQWDW